MRAMNMARKGYGHHLPGLSRLPGARKEVIRCTGCNGEGTIDVVVQTPGLVVGPTRYRPITEAQRCPKCNGKGDIEETVYDPFSFSGVKY